MNEELLKKSTEVAQRAANTIGGTFTQGSFNPQGQVVGGFSPITSESLAGNETPINIPTIPQSTVAAGITGASPSIVQNVNDRIAQDQAAKEAEVKNQKGLIQSTIDRISGVQTERTNAEGDINTPGTPVWQKEQARKLSLNIDRSQRAQLNELKALETQNMTTTGASAAQAGINRKYAFEQGDLQLQYHIANSDYLATQDTLNKMTELKLEPLKTQLNYQTAIYQDLQGSLTKAEDRQFQQLISQSENALTQEQDNINTIRDYILKYPTAGISMNDTVEQAAQKVARLSATSGGQDAPTIKSINGVDMQWNPTTGKWEVPAGISAGTTSGGGGISGKPLTAAQQTAFSYANRVKDSNIIIDEVGDQFTGTESYFGQYAPNFLKSAERQKFEQAQRNFVNAVLRRESGAAIAESEFDSAKIQYFPQPGDTEEVLAQKKANRDRTLSNMMREGGQKNIIIAPDGTEIEIID